VTSERIGTADGILRPLNWADALRVRAEHPQATAICGGTDLMVGINFDQIRPSTLLDLSRVAELRTWEITDSGRTVRLGAGVTYTRIINELAKELPGLAMAARTVGSPQVRNAGTVGGNLGTASPAGDSHPVLLAGRAHVEAESVHGDRLIPIDDFFVGPKRNALEKEEMIRAIRIPVATGPQQFAKIGQRNAMVIATTSLAVNLDVLGRRVGTGIGSAGPTPLRAVAAEALVEDALSDSWEAPGEVDDELATEFGRLVAAGATPIDDVRGTADYRRHALSVLGRRLLKWAWADLKEAGHS
jgi:CO/xanthine dehydrogenase FAD-binding subunit